MKETNEKTTKQLDEKELEQVTGGTENNQTNPAAPDAQSDEGQKITGSAYFDILKFLWFWGRGGRK